MSGCRKTQDLFYYLKTKDLKELKNLLTGEESVKLTYQDTIGNRINKQICLFEGHNIKVYDENCHPHEFVCTKCNQFITLSKEDEVLRQYIEKFIKQYVEYNLTNGYIEFKWRQNGCDGNNLKEEVQIREIQAYIMGRLGDRLMEFYYENGFQHLYFRHPETIKNKLQKLI